ncbi:hypothetical protein BS333_07385 [Vibrio azureus]|uniref:Fimbrial-type adhesion domain-containing protein n=1 Tax=Vibrio azureus NBRC 104587 TaxID=1219077 RepID=U3AY20_9VIBR|nr:hypothetical protein [Vibrio azureus]AUI86226.1 hypothetical protein BS333_07385 [Vibrio azureus]GAD78122.1 hypothetical protein VAZ01S_128_00050 [Vibrio azureus NBRC 104587]
MKAYNLVGVCLFIYISYPIQALSKTIGLSPGDEYIASVRVSLQGSATTSPNAGICFGFSRWMSSGVFCTLPVKYSQNGVTATINSASANVRYRGQQSFMSVSDEQVSECVTEPQGQEYKAQCKFSENSATDNGVFLFHKHFTGTDRVTYQQSAQIRTIRIRASSSATPGRHTIYTSIAAIDGSKWKFKEREDITVEVRNNTCTLSSNDLDIGSITPNEDKVERLNISLSCTDSQMGGSSWRFNEITDSTTNKLNDVSLQILDSNNNILMKNEDYIDPSELNKLKIRVNAGPSAEMGEFSTKFKFTLTYS